jgi:ABC-type polysaccharide/polyol phosphate export permease
MNAAQLPTVEIVDANNKKIDWRRRIKELYSYRYLLQNMIVRDLKVRYKNSILGVLWSLLNPLLMMVVFTLVFSIMMQSGIRQYSVFILVGLLPWNFFSSSLMIGATSVTSGASLVKKVYFPREALPIAVVMSGLVNFALAFLVLLIFLYASGLGLTRHALWIPALLVTQVIFTLGLCLFLSALHVFYRDVAMILDAGMLAWFFLTPVFYPLEWLGESLEIAGYTFSPAVVMRWVNPMASLIDGYRTVLWGNYASESVGAAAMDPSYLLRTFVTALIIFIVGYVFFVRTEHLFGEKL